MTAAFLPELLVLFRSLLVFGGINELGPLGPLAFVELRFRETVRKALEPHVFKGSRKNNSFK